MTTTKTKPKSSKQTPVAAAIDALVTPFGWTLSGPIAKTNELTDWLDGRTCDMPAHAWRAIQIPDAKDCTRAAAAAILRTREDFEEFALIILSPTGDPAEIAQQLDAAILERITAAFVTQGAETPFCTVLSATTSGPLQLWFGRKAGRKPDLEGPNAMFMLRSLFECAERSDRLTRLEEEAAPARKETVVRSANRKLVAKRDSGPVVDPATGHTMQLIPIDAIIPDETNRTITDASVKDLAANIKAVGLLQPIIVRPIAESKPQRYVITAGERRWRACRLAGFKTIPAIIRETAGTATDVTRLSENLLRENLTSSELAAEYSRLIESGKTQKQIGELFGVTQGQISSTIRLLKLPAAILKHVDTGDIAPTLIRCVLPFTDVDAIMQDVAKKIERFRADKIELTVDDMETALDDAVRHHSRPMVDCTTNKVDAYSKPQKHDRLFALTDATKNQLDIRKVKDQWGRESEAAFNTTLFDQLNKEPLETKLEKHKALRLKAHKTMTSHRKAKGTDSTEYFTSRWNVSRAISGSLNEALAVEIEALKPSAKDTKLRRIVLTLVLAASDGTIPEFLHDFFGIEAKPNKSKKGKAA